MTREELEAMRSRFVHLMCVRLRKRYKFYPQRLAIAARAWHDFYDYKLNQIKQQDESDRPY